MKLTLDEHKVTRAEVATWVILYLVIVILMANLAAVVDRVLYPDAPYFDKGHMSTGLATGIATAVLFGALILYNFKLWSALRKERLLEAARQASEEKYRDLFHESREMAFIISTEGSIIDVNEAGARLFGYTTPDTMVYANFATDMVVNPSDFQTLFHDIDVEGFVKDFEMKVRRLDGKELDVAITATAVRAENGDVDGCRGILRDTTEFRNMEHQLLDYHRMESYGKLARGVAHEFNDAMTTIQGYTEIIARDIEEDSPAAEGIKEIGAAAGRVNKLTGELLMFSRDKALDPRAMNLNDMLRESSSMIQRVTGEGVTVKQHPAKDVRIISADRSSIEKALVNLLIYSCERMDLSGELTISTGNLDVSEAAAKADPHAVAGHFATLSIADNGPVITEDEREHIFEPFAARDVISGSGMMLSVVYGIVTHHEGWIDVQSSPSGTVFMVCLPVQPKGTVSEVRPTIDICELQGDGRKILLVEDEDSVRVLAEKMLTENGYTVFPARDANEAFSIFASRKEEIDAIFCDVVLPGESGIELADHLSEYDSNLPVLLTSGDESYLEKWQSIQDHGYSFVPKPYKLSQLLMEMKKVFINN
jgi:PAS domain S-box-containing protein